MYAKVSVKTEICDERVWMEILLQKIKKYIKKERIVFFFLFTTRKPTSKA